MVEGIQELLREFHDTARKYVEKHDNPGTSGRGDASRSADITREKYVSLLMSELNLSPKDAVAVMANVSQDCDFVSFLNYDSF